jgi:hypothetical protein
VGRGAHGARGAEPSRRADRHGQAMLIAMLVQETALARLPEPPRSRAPSCRTGGARHEFERAASWPTPPSGRTTATTPHGQVRPPGPLRPGVARARRRDSARARRRPAALAGRARRAPQGAHGALPGPPTRRSSPRQRAEQEDSIARRSGCASSHRERRG